MIIEPLALASDGTAWAAGASPVGSSLATGTRTVASVGDGGGTLGAKPGGG
jgi:hypothetical protein